MAAELVPGGIRVQAIFQGVSGLPEDRYVNTWHFADIGGGPTVEADLITAGEQARDFYVDSTSTGSAVQNWLAKDAIDVGASHLRAYDLSVPDPREPVIVPFTGLSAATVQVMPNEVAVCLSFYSLVNSPSSRGRIYLGPLTTVAIESGSAPATPLQNLLDTMAEAALELKLRTGPVWSILTHPGGGGPVLKTVTDGWIDDAFDTQRRRGQAPISRRTW